MEKWQECWPEWTVIIHVKSSWMPVNSSAPQRWRLGPIEFNIFTFRKFYCWYQGVWGENRADTEVPGQVSKWAERSYKRFNKRECMNNPMQLWTEWLETVSAEKELGSLWTAGWIQVSKVCLQQEGLLHIRLY